MSGTFSGYFQPFLSNFAHFQFVVLAYFTAKVSLTILVMGLFCIKTAAAIPGSEVEHGAMSTLLFIKATPRNDIGRKNQKY